MKVILTKEQEELLKSGTHIIDKYGNTWFYIPYWFKQRKEMTSEYKVFSPDTLPEEFRIQLERLRK